VEGVRTQFSHSNLVRADFQKAKLGTARFSDANLSEANFAGADLRQSNFGDAFIHAVNMRGCSFDEADFYTAHFISADLTDACLCGANLTSAIIQESKFIRADLSNCSVYGASVWDVDLTEAIQFDLLVTSPREPALRLDNLAVAQFVHLLLKNEAIRHVIDTITSKVVLILGRFTPARKIVLDLIRDELRKRDYLPVLFDFEKPENRDITETVSALAHMARFVIADITHAKSIAQELMRIVPALASVPVQPYCLPRNMSTECSSISDVFRGFWRRSCMKIRQRYYLRLRVR
jgi:hypothetical protein